MKRELNLEEMKNSRGGFTIIAVIIWFILWDTGHYNDSPEHSKKNDDDDS